MNGWQRESMDSQKTVLVRASISFPPDLYKTLEEIAKQKKVFLATGFPAPKTAILVPQLKRHYVAAPRHEKEPAVVKVYEVQ
jgi:hypothetical protein